MKRVFDKSRYKLEDLQELCYSVGHNFSEEMENEIHTPSSNLKELEELERRFIFAESKLEADSVMAKIIKLLPNDLDLGGYIRNLYANKMWK